MPGKPSARDIVNEEHRRRLNIGLARDKLSREAKELKKWLNLHYPSAPSMEVGTIENAIRDEHRAAKTKEVKFKP